MKKIFAAVFASLLLVSVAATADQITSVGDSGYPGGPAVKVNVSLNSGGAGNFSFGADFNIAFESSKLALSTIRGATSDFAPLFVTTAGQTVLSLTNSGSEASPLGSIYSIEFFIVDTYRFSLPDFTEVVIDWFTKVNDRGLIQVVQSSSTARIDIINAPANAAPEPGALALVGLALVIMVGFDRRRRVHRG